MSLLDAAVVLRLHTITVALLPCFTVASPPRCSYYCVTCIVLQCWRAQSKIEFTCNAVPSAAQLLRQAWLQAAAVRPPVQLLMS